MSNYPSVSVDQRASGTTNTEHPAVELWEKVETNGSCFLKAWNFYHYNFLKMYTYYCLEVIMINSTYVLFILQQLSAFFHVQGVDSSLICLTPSNWS